MSSLSPRPLAPAAAGRTSERAAGETTFKFNEPAKAGRVLPGLSGEAHVWDDRLSFGISETYGRDLADGRRVLTSQQLGHGANWQREAGFNLTVPESDALNFSMFGGLYDARRPARLRERALHLGEVETWGEHQGIDIGFNLGLLDNRVRYKGGYAWSDYERVELNTERAASGNGFGPTGDAQQHRLEVDILTEGSLKMSAYGLYQTGDPSFRRPRRSGVKQPFTIGETREIGTSLRLDELRFSLVQQDRAYIGREQERTEGKITYGPLALSLFQKEDTRADTNEVQQWHEESTGGQVRFDLERLREGDEFSLQRLLPSAVTLGTERGLRQLSWAPDSPDSPETTHSLGLSWAWDQADTDLSIYRRTYDSRALGAESADETEYGLDLSHSLYRDSWDLTAYLWAGSFLSQEVDYRSRDVWGGGGLLASYYPKHLPDVSLALDLNYYDSVYPDFKEQFGDRALSLDLTIDLSKYLNNGSKPDYGPSLQMHYYVMGSHSWDSYSGQSLELEQAVALTLALRF